MRKRGLPIIAGAAGGILGAAIADHLKKKKVNAIEETSEKRREFYHVLVQWLALKQKGRSLAEYFEKNNYKTVAIYGMKELGERLYDELQDTDIAVKYIIDKNAGQIICDIDVVAPEDTLENVDVVVVTAIHYFDEIEKELSKSMTCPIVSLEDVVYDMV